MKAVALFLWLCLFTVSVFAGDCKTVLADLQNSPQNQLRKVREFAIQAHGDQKYGDRPYITHLDQVAQILIDFGFNDLSDQYHLILLKAAYMHDVIEDSKLGDRKELYGMVFRTAGAEAAEIARRVTDADIPGASRKVIKHATYPQIWAHHGATVVKLADRIANVKNAKKDQTARPWERYTEEQADFRAAVFHPGVAEDMWSYLEKLLQPD